MKKITIAIDGFSSSGKSTMARQLAKEIGYLYVDSGAMYRAVTLFAIRNGLAAPGKGVDAEVLTARLPEIHIAFALQPDGTQHTMLNGEDVEKEIRTMEVSEVVSPVAVIPEVRHRLVAMQQEYGRDKGIVMDGRDIGTTVFPDAEMKIFVDASPEVRARRRQLEMRQKNEDIPFEEILANVKERDRIDSTREESPLRKADDAIVLCNDNMSLEEQHDWLIKTFEQIVGK